LETLAVIGAVGLVLFLVWPRIQNVLSARRNEGKAVEGLENVIGETAARRECVVLYFYSPGCGACRSMTPRVERLGRDCDNIHAINAEDHRDWVLGLGVTGLPSVAVIRNGRLEQLALGTASDRRLRTMAESSPQSQPA
jgi:thioredoxin 1